MNFIKVSSSSPKTRVGDIEFNILNIKNKITKAHNLGCKIIVFPELCVTSYTCFDLFLKESTITKSYKGVKDLINFSKDFDILIILGSIFEYNSSLFNCGFVIHKGSLLGIIPKTYLPNYGEFYEKRYFSSLDISSIKVNFLDYETYFGCDILFKYKDVVVGVEICEDLWAPIPKSSYLSINGANIICNLSSSNEVNFKHEYRRDLIKHTSKKLNSAYIYSNSNVNESTTDLLFSSYTSIYENGVCLSESERFLDSSLSTSIIDIDILKNARRKNGAFKDSIKHHFKDMKIININFDDINYKTFDRYISKSPFIYKDDDKNKLLFKEILDMQDFSLRKRLNHINLNKAIIGISGGLDSTLCLISVYRAFKMFNIPEENIIGITMPGLGTSDRTKNNANMLMKHLGITHKSIDIKDSVLKHFKDIGQDENVFDVTYENSQARERTQILMDLSNKEKGLLLGTSDLSEIALGFSTYNGDHMSMYNINSSIPKTLIRPILKYYYEEECTIKAIKDILIDIIDTKISPELLPLKDGEIIQDTEKIIGPYELHDFFLYYFMKYNLSSEKILFLATSAFKESYDETLIKSSFNTFIKRFFSNQFKRSCMPDGPKITEISLSPRGDLKMSSDSSYNSFLI